MGCDLGFNGGGWPILVVVGLVIFGLLSGFQCVVLVFRWLRFGLVVFGLLVIYSLLVCHGFARRGYGFCSKIGLTDGNKNQTHSEQNQTHGEQTHDKPTTSK